MYSVYLIKSKSFSEKLYVGYTTNLDKRFASHNSGNSAHTTKYKPWQLLVYFCFAEKQKAAAFERYLKSQSGRAFIQKRLL
jgi:predicted GIY-YIG superfamily endonuclease